jgi:hypothetical protein
LLKECSVFSILIFNLYFRFFFGFVTRSFHGYVLIAAQRSFSCFFSPAPLEPKSPPNSGGHEMFRRGLLEFSVVQEARSWLRCHQVTLLALQLAADIFFASCSNTPIDVQTSSPADVLAFSRKRTSPFETCSMTAYRVWVGSIATPKNTRPDV